MAETTLSIWQKALGEIGTRSTISAADITAVQGGATQPQEAFYCNLFYNDVIEQALRAAHWGFCKVVDNLTLWKALPGTPENQTQPTTNGWLTTYPAPPWTYSYKYPTDCIQGRVMMGQPQQVPLNPPIFSGTFQLAPPPISQKLPSGRFEVALDKFDQSGVLLTTRQKVLLTNLEQPIFEYTILELNESIWDPDFVTVIYTALAGKLAIPLTGKTALARDKITIANNTILEARVRDANEGLTINDHIPDWIRTRGVGGGLGYEMYFYPFGPLFPISPLV